MKTAIQFILAIAGLAAVLVGPTLVTGEPEERTVDQPENHVPGAITLGLFDEKLADINAGELFVDGEFVGVRSQTIGGDKPKVAARKVGEVRKGRVHWYEKTGQQSLIDPEKEVQHIVFWIPGLKAEGLIP
jgi:hypothetical protein